MQLCFFSSLCAAFGDHHDRAGDKKNDPAEDQAAGQRLLCIVRCLGAAGGREIPDNADPGYDHCCSDQQKKNTEEYFHKNDENRVDYISSNIRYINRISMDTFASPGHLGATGGISGRKHYRMEDCAF